MLDRKLCESLFNMDERWHIVKLEKRTHQNRIDIWVSTKGGIGNVSQWFRRSWSSHADIAIWQHLSLGECRVYVHAALNEDRSVPWLGEENSPFSNALASKVVALFSERLSYSTICSLLNVDVQDVWVLKNLIDKGELKLGGSLSLDVGTSKPVVEPPATNHRENFSTRVPAAEDPIWLQVLNGDVDINIRQLGLKLLLKRARTHFGNVSDNETKMLRVHELRKYFVKHERFLQYELKQIA